MGGWGRQNPWPFQWGGGRSTFEQWHDALREMLGTGGAAPKGTLEDAWRESKVSGIIKVVTMSERAALQALPSKATDHLDVYEAILKVPRQSTDQGRREAVAAAWTEALSGVLTTIEAKLVAIDAQISLELHTRAQSTTVQFGPPFETDAGVLASFDLGEAQTAFPGFSSHFMLYVLWQGQPAGIPDPTTRTTVERELNKSLPSWWDWRIITKQGFTLDQDPLDVTGL